MPTTTSNRTGKKKVRPAKRRVERRKGKDRRSGVDRRLIDIPVAVDRRWGPDRRSGEDRRQCPLA